MIRSNYFRYKSESTVKPDLTVGGSLCGATIKTGEIDISITSQGGSPGVGHTVQGALTLDEAEDLAKLILSEVAEVRYKLDTGKWKHEVEVSVPDFAFIQVAPVSTKVLQRLDRAIQESSHHSKTANHFYHLRERIRSGKKLTKKMRENLAWIEKEVEEES